jgi:hypothetical protein
VQNDAETIALGFLRKMPPGLRMRRSVIVSVIGNGAE